MLYRTTQDRVTGDAKVRTEGDKLLLKAFRWEEPGAAGGKRSILT